MPPVFELLRATGGAKDEEIYQVLNMGIGMTIIVSAEHAEKILKHIRGS